MKTKVEILDDVVKHIKKQGGRAVNGVGCAYIAKDGKTCGHSMALKQKYRKMATPNITAKEMIRKYGDKIHLKKYQGYGINFWQDVQNFHDDVDNWDIQGNITEDGTGRLNHLKEFYTTNDEG